MDRQAGSIKSGSGNLENTRSISMLSENKESLTSSENCDLVFPTHCACELRLGIIEASGDDTASTRRT